MWWSVLYCYICHIVASSAHLLALGSEKKPVSHSLNGSEFSFLRGGARGGGGGGGGGGAGGGGGGRPPPHGRLFK